MTKHNQAAEGDRHPPVNRTFNNAAARLAYAYTADDVGKWYKDDDTNIIWELDNSYLPGFSQISAVGTALYNYPFRVLTVDLNEPSADYSTVAAAIAAAVSGDVISIGPGTYTCNNQTLPAGVDMVGFGIDITILTTTGETALTIGDDSHIADMTIESVNLTGNAFPLVIDGAAATLDSIKVTATDDASSNAAYGIHTTGDSSDTVLIGCQTFAGGGTAYGVYAEGDCQIHHGIYDGGDASIYVDNATVKLVGPQFVASPTPILESNGTISGAYFDYNGDIVIGRYETGNLPSPEQGGKLLYDITTGNLLLDIGLSLKIV